MTRQSSTTKKALEKARIPPKTDLKVAPVGYQPSKTELEDEVTMPNLSEEQARALFMRPFRLVREVPTDNKR